MTPLDPGTPAPDAAAAPGDFDPVAAIDALLDGDITPTDHAALDRWLAADPTHADLLAQRARLHRSLHALTPKPHAAAQGSVRVDPLADARFPAVAPPKPHAAAQRGVGVSPARRIPRPLYALAALAAAILLAAAAVGVYLAAFSDESNPSPQARDAKPTPPVAVLVNAHGVSWTSEPINVGADIVPGELSIGAGSVELAMTSGATVELTGPADLQLHAGDRVELMRGSLLVNGTPGFTAAAPYGVRVVDLGTRFRLELADAGARAIVSVVSGSVRVDSPQAEPRVAEAGAVATYIRGVLQTVPLIVAVRSSSHRDYVVHRGGLSDGALIYTDRAYRWGGEHDGQTLALPDVLRGADYVQPPNADKDERVLDVTLELGRAAAVYVIQNPNTRAPAWLRRDFEPTGLDVPMVATTNAGTSVLRYRVWRRVVTEPGTLTLGPKEDGDLGPAGMYALAVQPLTGPPLDPTPTRETQGERP